MHQIFGYSNCSQNKRNSNLDVHLNFQAEVKKFHILANHGILVQINQLLKSFDQIHPISLEFKHLEHFLLLFPFLGRILKKIK
jgi:hypothetical protein